MKKAASPTTSPSSARPTLPILAWPRHPRRPRLRSRRQQRALHHPVDVETVRVCDGAGTRGREPVESDDRCRTLRRRIQLDSAERGKSPFNPMVNAGAIACSGLVREAKGNDAFECIRRALPFCRAHARLRPRRVRIRVHDRRPQPRHCLPAAHAWRAESRVDLHSTSTSGNARCLVTARDLSIMAATLANRGGNPMTGVSVMTPYGSPARYRSWSVPACRNYAGEWIYRVGIPAKSGVGGRHSGGAAGKAWTWQLFPPARQARQQRAGHQGVRGAVVALRFAYA